MRTYDKWYKNVNSSNNVYFPSSQKPYFNSRSLEDFVRMSLIGNTLSLSKAPRNGIFKFYLTRITYRTKFKIKGIK